MDKPEDRGFARAARPDQRDDLAAWTASVNPSRMGRWAGMPERNLAELDAVHANDYRGSRARCAGEAGEGGR